MKNKTNKRAKKNDDFSQTNWFHGIGSMKEWSNEAKYKRNDTISEHTLETKKNRPKPETLDHNQTIKC